MTKEDFADARILHREAMKYAVGFLREDDAMKYPIGCPHFAFNKAFLYAIETARLLYGGKGTETPSIELLKMAIEELESER